MKKISLIILILVILINVSYSQYSSFGMEVLPKQERCLSEYYKTSTIVIFELNADNEDIALIIESPDGNAIYSNQNYTSLYSFTTKSSGYYTVCCKNVGKNAQEVNLIIKSGISANDFSSLAKSKDLAPIDYELDKILEKQAMLNHFSKVSQVKQNQFTFIYKSISSKIIFYSLLMIAGMILIGVIETLYLKRFMEKRKII